jgi:hypothetical protein
LLDTLERIYYLSFKEKLYEFYKATYNEKEDEKKLLSFRKVLPGQIYPVSIWEKVIDFA